MRCGLSRRDFDELFAHGRRISLPQVRLIYDAGQGRIGIATSRKIGNRPQRNRQRRTALEIVRSLGGVPSGLDVILVLQESFAQGTITEKQLWVDTLFQQIREEPAENSGWR